MGARDGADGAGEGGPDFGLEGHHIWDGLLDGDEVAHRRALVGFCRMRVGRGVGFIGDGEERGGGGERFVSAFGEKRGHLRGAVDES